MPHVIWLITATDQAIERHAQRALQSEVRWLGEKLLVRGAGGTDIDCPRQEDAAEAAAEDDTLFQIMTEEAKTNLSRAGVA